MLFTEPVFLFVFLPALLALYVAVPLRHRNAVLTVASLIFYAAGESRFLPWLLGSIAVNYWIAIGLDRHRGTAYARPLLALGVASDLALLVVFKYADFLVENLNRALSLGHVPPLAAPGLALPLGISFFTFHKISYKVDVYRGTAEVRRQPLDLALYVLLFPQLIAGPIIRYHDIADQLVRRTLDWPSFAEGVRRFVVGFGKKMILADTFAFPADRIFAIPDRGLTSPLAWLGVLCYTLQIYFDFSGYSDMAIGLGRMLGFRFLENFDRPYTARSVTEFWRRWHISLSRWFRDYVYVPLGGNRRGPARTALNLIAVFFLCGLWHGASWHFVAWGLFHGTFLGLERLRTGRALAVAPAPLARLYTLLVVMVGWVLFRAEGARAWPYLKAMAGLGAGDGVEYHTGIFLDRELLLTIAIGIGLSLFPWPIVPRRSAEGRAAGPGGVLLATSELLFLGAVFTYSVMLVAAGTYSPFLYFRF